MTNCSFKKAHTHYKFSGSISGRVDILRANYATCRVLKVPDFPEGKAPDTSFAELKNPKAFISDAFSICFWVSVTFEHHAEILSRAEKSGLVITFLSHGNYVDLGEHSVRFQIPDKFDFLPEKWIFLCLSYKKILKVYLNSVLIFDQYMENHSMNFKLDESFLKHIQLGKASNFAGELSRVKYLVKSIRQGGYQHQLPRCF